MQCILKTNGHTKMVNALTVIFSNKNNEYRLKVNRKIIKKKINQKKNKTRRSTGIMLYEV